MIECVVVFPQHGIQLETHKGFKGLVLFSSRTFIPFANLDDVVINEALYGWNVRYYIVALTKAGNGDTVLKVAFPVSLPKSRLDGTPDLTSCSAESLATLSHPQGGVHRNPVMHTKHHHNE